MKKAYSIILFLLISCNPPDDPPSTVNHLGTWKTDCIFDDSSNSNVIHDLIISKDFVELTVNVYNVNSDCTSDDSISKFYTKATYTRTNDSYETVLKNYEFTPITSFISFDGFCDLSWEVGVTQSIIDKNCIDANFTNLSRSSNEENTFAVTRSGNTLELENYPSFVYELQ